MENIRDYIPEVKDLVLARQNLLGDVLEQIGQSIKLADSRGIRTMNYYTKANLVVSDVIDILSGKATK